MAESKKPASKSQPDLSPANAGTSDVQSEPKPTVPANQISADDYEEFKKFKALKESTGITLADIEADVIQKKENQNRESIKEAFKNNIGSDNKLEDILKTLGRFTAETFMKSTVKQIGDMIYGDKIERLENKISKLESLNDSNSSGDNSSATVTIRLSDKESETLNKLTLDFIDNSASELSAGDIFTGVLAMVDPASRLKNISKNQLRDTLNTLVDSEKIVKTGQKAGTKYARSTQNTWKE